MATLDPMSLIRLDSLLAGAVGVAVGMAAGIAILPDRAPGPAMVGPDRSELESVTAELRAIRELLSGPEVTPAPSSAPATRRAALPPSSELLAALGSLEAALRLASAPTAPDTPAGLRPLDRDRASRPADLTVVRVARERVGQLEGDGPYVVDDFFGLSPPQVYERFGTPARIGNSPGRVRWLYEDPDYPGYLVVTFIDGYVAWIHQTSE